MIPAVKPKFDLAIKGRVGAIRQNQVLKRPRYKHLVVNPFESRAKRKDSQGTSVIISESSLQENSASKLDKLVTPLKVRKNSVDSSQDNIISGSKNMA